jgi:hypothetical protein
MPDTLETEREEARLGMRPGARTVGAGGQALLGLDHAEAEQEQTGPGHG